MKKFLAIFFGVLVLCIIKNPNGVYYTTTVTATPINQDQLLTENGEIYNADRELLIDKTYTIILEHHPNRVIIQDYWEED